VIAILRAQDFFRGQTYVRKEIHLDTSTGAFEYGFSGGKRTVNSYHGRRMMNLLIPNHDRKESI